MKIDYFLITNVGSSENEELRFNLENLHGGLASAIFDSFADSDDY